MEQRTLTSDLTQLATAQPTAKRLLLVTTDGQHHEEIQTATKPFRSLPVFYLAGGRVAYEHFFADRLSQQQRQTVTVSSQAQSTKGFQNTPRATVGKRSCCGK